MAILAIDTREIPTEITNETERELLAKLASEVNTDGALIIIYNQPEIWRDRKAAAAFYLDCMYNSEGAENERYQNVFFDLLEGKRVCYDGATWLLTRDVLYK